jgi:hypothetical protein
MSLFSFLKKFKFLVISILALIKGSLPLLFKVLELLFVVFDFLFSIGLKKLVLQFKIVVSLSELFKLFFQLDSGSLVSCSQITNLLMMNLLEFFNLLLSILSSIVTFSSFAFNGFNHLIVSLSGFIEL